MLLRIKLADSSWESEWQLPPLPPSLTTSYELVDTIRVASNGSLDPEKDSAALIKGEAKAKLWADAGVCRVIINDINWGP